MSTKATRIKAAELAATAVAGREVEIKHLWSVMVLFENYIDLGAEKTDKMMGIMRPPEVVKLSVVK